MKKLNLNIPQNAFVIGAIGALAQCKDFPTLIRAFSHLVTDNQCYLLIVGEGDERFTLQQLTKEFDIADKIIFCGFQSDIGKYLAAMDLFALSSKSEGLGTSILDAMFFSLPVVATDVGGIPEIVEHGKSGLLSPVGDYRTMASNLSSLIISKKMRQVFGNHSKILAEKFSIQNTIEKTLAIYKKVNQ